MLSLPSVLVCSYCNKVLNEKDMKCTCEKFNKDKIKKVKFLTFEDETDYWDVLNDGYYKEKE